LPDMRASLASSSRFWSSMILLMSLMVWLLMLWKLGIRPQSIVVGSFGNCRLGTTVRSRRPRQQKTPAKTGVNCTIAIFLLNSGLIHQWNSKPKTQPSLASESEMRFWFGTAMVAFAKNPNDSDIAYVGPATILWVSAPLR